MSRFSIAVAVGVMVWSGSLAGTQSSAAPAASTPAFTQSAPVQGMLTGTIAYRERVALPADAAVAVKLEDISGHSPKTVAETLFSPGGQQVPIPFQLSYNPADINPAHTYRLLANIAVDGKPMFVSTAAYPVITQGNPTQVAMMLEAAPSQPSPAAGTKLYGTHWMLAELDGKPAAPGEGKPVHLVLHKKGKLSGFAGCNQVTGTYIAQQGAMQFTPAATTMKMCSQPVMQQEQAFLAALKATTAYQVNGNTLELLNGDKPLAKLAGEGKQ